MHLRLPWFIAAIWSTRDDIKKIIKNYESEVNHSEDLRPEFLSGASLFSVILKNPNYGKSSEEAAIKFGIRLLNPKIRLLRLLSIKLHANKTWEVMQWPYSKHMQWWCFRTKGYCCTDCSIIFICRRIDCQIKRFWSDCRSQRIREREISLQWKSRE